jgi:uncharacterized protein YrrD
MRLSQRDIKGIPVFTRSGERIATLDGVIIDSESATVASYVARTGPLPTIMPKELLIAPVQVVSFDNEKMVVQDATVAETAGFGSVVPKPAPHAPGISSSTLTDNG